MGAFSVPNFASASSGGSALMSGSLPSAGGSNQYGNYPAMTLPTSTKSTPTPIWNPVPVSSSPLAGGSTAGAPGTVPSGGSLPFASNGYPTTASASGGFGLQGGAASVPSANPQFSQEYGSMLSGILGQGIAPYNLQGYLPSTGGSTAPGQVAAPLTPELQQLQQFLQTGQGGGAGAQTLQSLSTTGDPIDQTPAWQAMVAAEGQNTAINEANLKEQFASMGNLSSSSAANAMSQFQQQNTLNQNAQLTQAQTQAMQQAVQNQMTAGTTLFGAGQSEGQFTQGLDQTSINNLMNEYFMTTPEENPLNQEEFGLASTYPSVYTKQGNVGQAVIGSLGSILQGAGSVIDSNPGGIFGG